MNYTFNILLAAMPFLVFWAGYNAGKHDMKLACDKALDEFELFPKDNIVEGTVTK